METTTRQEALSAALARHQRRAEEIAADLARNAASLRDDVAAGVDVEARLGLIDRAASDLRGRLAATAALAAFGHTITEEN